MCGTQFIDGYGPGVSELHRIPACPADHRQRNAGGFCTCGHRLGRTLGHGYDIAALVFAVEDRDRVVFRRCIDRRADAGSDGHLGDGERKSA